MFAQLDGLAIIAVSVQHVQETVLEVTANGVVTLWSVLLTKRAPKTVEHMELVSALVQVVHANVVTVILENFVISHHASKTVGQMELVLVVVQAVHANVETVTPEKIVISHHVHKIAMAEELAITAYVFVTPVSQRDN